MAGMILSAHLLQYQLYYSEIIYTNAEIIRIEIIDKIVWWSYCIITIILQK